MTVHSTNLQQVVAAAAMGDRASFAKLVEAHTATVCAITLAITGEIQSSEDVAQDVFMAAWLGVGQLRNATSFGPWLRQLARNKSNEFVRMARRRRKRIFVDGGNALAVAVDDTPMTSEQLILAEQESMLAEVLASLPDDTREVVILYYREGRSVRQVASLLDTSETVVRKRMSRARARIRKDIEAKLAVALLATVPGTAFSLRVKRALDTAPVSRGGISTARAMAAIAAAAVVMLTLGWQVAEGGATPGPGPGPVAPSSAPTDRDEAQPANDAVPVPQSSEPAPIQQLHVFLSQEDQLNAIRVETTFVPSRWFPSLADGVLPVSKTTSSLDLLHELEVRQPVDAAELAPRCADKRQHSEDCATHDMLTEQLLNSAHEEGLLPLEPALLEDPGRALLALEAYRREDLRLSASQTVVAGNTTYRPARPDHSVARELSWALWEAAADPAVATLAGFEFLEFAPLAWSSDDVRVATHILHEASDPEVEDAAAGRLAWLRGLSDAEPFDKATLRTLTRLQDELEDGHRRDELTLALLTDARSRGDLIALRQGLERFGDRGSCDKEGDFYCDFQNNRRDAVSAQLRGLSEVPPKNWRQALMAAVWDCHRASPAPKNSLTIGRGVFEGRWQWEEWGRDASGENAAEAAYLDASPDVTSVTVSFGTPHLPMAVCLESLTSEAPLPEPGTRVELHIGG